MKKLFILRKAFLVTGLIAMSFVSCKDGAKQQEDTREAAEERNETQFEEADSKEDQASFFVDIAEINLLEIEAAKLALQKGTDTEVKNYAKMLVTEHTKAGAELKTIADTKQIALPTSLTDKGKDAYNKLNEKSGNDFDKEFIKIMIDDHEKTIKELEDASTDKDNDQNVKDWASNKIAGLTAHLQEAKMIKDKLDKK
jgi:putative membrane protein